MKEVILPELGEGIEKAVVAVWHYSVGDEVGQDDDLVELVTDKASFQVPAGVGGTIKEICVKEGQEALIGRPLALIEPN